MSVIHIDFGSGSPLPPVPRPSGPLSAAELAQAAKDWMDEVVEQRQRLSPAERRAAAEESISIARECLDDDPNHRAWLTVIGRHAWAARIMMAED